MKDISYRVYIAESGNNGFVFHSDGSGNSRWLVLSAVVVRTRKDRSLELTSVFPECAPGWRKVVDIFGNDTMTIIDVTVGGKRQ